MKKGALNKITVLLCLCLSICACENKPNWTGSGLIKQEGSYKTKNHYLIIVSINNDLLNYKICNETKQIILKSTRNISTLNKWFLYWDDATKILWVGSSDVGSSYWSKSKSIYVETIITDKNKDFIENKIPETIKASILD